MPFDAALIRLPFDFLPDFRLSFFGDFFYYYDFFFGYWLPWHWRQGYDEL